MYEDDEALLDAVKAKDSDAMAEYAERHRSQLLAYIQRRLGAALRRKVEPEDILQQASVDAVNSLPEMDFSQREPFSWLCHIAERRIIDAHRFHFGAQKRDAGREVALDAGGGQQEGALIHLLVASMTTPSQAFSRNAREAKLQDALEGLPELQREALRLRYVEGWASKQIAEQLGKTDAAIRVMLSRSLKQLQTILGPELP